MQSESYTVKASGTLLSALSQATSIFSENPSACVEILLEDRYYLLKETLKINRINGPGNSGSLIFRAMEGAHPKIGSAIPVSHWKPVSSCSIPADIVLSEKQQNKLFAAEVPGEAGYVHALFQGEKILRRGKSAPFEPRLTEVERLRSFNVARREDQKLLRQIPAPGAALKNIRQSKDLEILFTAVPWQLSILPVERFDLDRELVITSQDGTVAAFHKIHDASWLENQPEFLENPGEWAFDSRSRQVFLYPENNQIPHDICVPLLKELILVEGDIDYEGPEDKPLFNIHFEGITFLHGKRDTKDSSTKARGLQHDWEFFDRPNALLRFRGTENCTVKNCRFTAAGGVAVRGDLHCRHLVIEKNISDYVGSMGILLCGYGPGSKDVNRDNIIRNNLIHHTGEFYHHGHAVFLWQSGSNLVSHNTIHHVPRKAVGIAGIRLPLLELRDVTWDDSSLLIRWDEIDSATDGKGKILTDEIARCPVLHGRNNRVEYNDISRALEKLGDGAAVNISGAGEGNLIYRNYVHHIATNQASGAMRTDDWQSGTTFQENVIYMSNITGIVRKNISHLINNYLINVHTKQMVRFASFPDEESSKGALIVKNIFCDTESRFVLYNEGYTSPGMVHPGDTVSDFNMIWYSVDPDYAEQILDNNKKISIDGNSIAADSLFVNIENEDFRLCSDSPAHRLGILSLDVRETGIPEDFPEYLKQYDDSSCTGDALLYHRGRDKDKEDYLFW